MAQDSNAILKQIFGVVSQINKKMDDNGSSDKGAGPLSGLFGKKSSKGNKEAKNSAAAMTSIFDAITKFSKSKIDTKKIDMTAKSLKGLFDTVVYIGKSTTVVKNVLKIFNVLANSLNTMTKFAKAMSVLLLSVGVSIASIAGGIALAGKLLIGDSHRPLVTMAVITTVLAGITMTMVLMGKYGKNVKEGSETAKEMGIAMMTIAGGLFLFTLSLVSIGKIIGAKGGAEGMIIGITAAIGIIGVMSLIFYGLGKFAQEIGLGAIVGIAIGLGLASIAWGLEKFASTAQKITSLGDGGSAVSRAGKEKGKFGQMMSNIGPGLGIMGILLVSSALLFAALGVPVVAGLVALGAGVAIGMAVALKKVAEGTYELVKTADALKGVAVKDVVTNMIGGLIGGLVKGLSVGLTGTEASSASDLKLGGIAKLNRGIKMLRRMARMLSMFAKGLTAFAELGNMRVITGYDEETGEPKFGPTVNINNVGNTVRDTLISFLAGDDNGETGGILGATKTLTKRHAKSIKAMGRALTGRRGILTAVIKFAEVLKTYAEFGENNEVGWVELIPNGTDEDGNVIYKQEYHKTPVSKVVDNIAGSFSLFVTNLAAKANEFGIDGKEKRKLKNLSKALTGRKGILQPIIDFTKVIDAYAKYGESGEIVKYKLDSDGNPMYDEKGEPIELSRVPIKQIANNVASVLGSFSTALAGSLDSVNKKDGKAAEKKMKEFDGMISSLGKLSKNTEKLDVVAKSLMSIATSIGLLAESMNKLDADKLELVGKIGHESRGISGMMNNIQESNRIKREDKREEPVRQEFKEEKQKEYQTAKQESKPTPASTVTQPVINTEELANVIGASVAAAFRQGHFQFEFATDKSGVLSFS